jgi:hypothetical protein
MRQRPDGSGSHESPQQPDYANVAKAFSAPCHPPSSALNLNQKRQGNGISAELTALDNALNHNRKFAPLVLTGDTGSKAGHPRSVSS